MVPDADFRGDTPNGAVVMALARVAPVIASRPGLTVEVQGYTDFGGAEHEAIAARRAEQVCDALVGRGSAEA